MPDNAPRKAEINRNTLETKIRLGIDLDGSGQCECSTGIGFFDHMLDQLARHSLMDLTVAAEGDLHIDAHHTVEDVGIVLGQALKEALGERRGIRRFGDATVPLDEALTRAVIDISGRPGLFLQAEFNRDRIGELDLQLIPEFFQALVNQAGWTVHLDNLQGNNAHHCVESMFKAFARALRQATEIDPRAPSGMPSTKGAL